MGKYRKKPVVIEAVKWTGNIAEVFALVGHDLPTYGPPHDGALRIATLEGDHACLPAAWIIKGIKGEFYPCDPEIFEATYEEVKDA
jgi:hypothetical protein